MTKIRTFLIMTALAVLAACGERSKFQDYDGPEVTRVLLFKAERKLYLMHQDKELETYDVGLGFAPAGHKEVEGDGRTPEGHYLIDKRNPNSKFHLSIGISYPNPVDIARAESMGKAPGGDIFIHGRGPTYWDDAPVDWTWGCIAVTDEEIEKIYAMVANGTPISIYPSRAHMEAELKALRKQAKADRKRLRTGAAVAAPMAQPALPVQTSDPDLTVVTPPASGAVPEVAAPLPEAAAAAG